MTDLLCRVRRFENIKLVVAFIVLNILDAILTNVALKAGGIESNPIMRYLREQGTGLTWGVEIGSAIVVAFAFLVLATYSPRFIKIVLIVAVIYMAAVCLWGGIALYLHS
jgi:hypothetical protein